MPRVSQASLILRARAFPVPTFAFSGSEGRAAFEQGASRLAAPDIDGAFNRFSFGERSKATLQDSRNGFDSRVYPICK